MFTKIRKIIALSLTILMVVTSTIVSLPVSGVQAAETSALSTTSTSTATFLGTDTTTQGHWEGKYGGDGYALFGYKGIADVAPAQYYYGNMEKTTDLSKLPSYLTDYNFDPSMAGFYRTFIANNNDNTILDKPSVLPNGINSDKYNVGTLYGKPTSDGRNNMEFTFNLNDNKEHLFSFYTNIENNAQGDYFPYFSTTTGVEAIITDLNGNVIDDQKISRDTFKVGTYVTFAVKGSFKLEFITDSGDFGPNAFFFDTPAASVPTNITANVFEKTKVKIDWTNQGNPDNVLVEKSNDNINFSQVANVSGTTTEYTDTNVVASQNYYYRLRYMTGSKYSSSTSSVEASMPIYAPTKMTLQNSDLTTSVGGRVTVSAKLEDTSTDTPTPLAGKTVFFKLQGSHVGDGTTLGQEIPDDIGSAVTDANGIASVTYTCTYGGSFQVIATFAQDDVNNLSSSISNSKNLTVASIAWTSEPKVFKISDAVSAGNSFNINGYGINKNTVNIAIALDTTGASPAFPPSNAIHPIIIQTDDNSNFVVAKMPNKAAPGVYNVWVKNEYGWSAPYKMNAARAQYMSEYQAFKGLNIEVVGRNFDQKEFGGTTATKARLNNGNGKKYNLKIKSLNPYNVTFTVGDQPLGNYFVEVSNDNGKNWSRPNSDQELQIVTPGADPLGLGVAWAKDFNWSKVYDVTSAEYGANPNDKLDDTAAVQKAADAAEANGGGVVYFPNGSYYISTIKLGADVVLEGQNEYNTKLYYTGTGGEQFISSKGDSSIGGVAQLQGVAKLSLLLSDPNSRPDMFMWLGQQWGDCANDASLRTANRIFVKNVNLDYPIDNAGNLGTGRGIGLGYIAKERGIVEDNHFVGWYADASFMVANNYSTVKNNYFEYAKNSVQTDANYSFVENNHILGHPELNQESHGIFVRADTYVTNNLVENVGAVSNQNDGEGICADSPSSTYDFGLVLKATSNSVTTAPNVNYPNGLPSDINFGNLTITITNGRGLSQERRVTSIDPSTKIINVDKPFDVIPDSTSRFTLYTPDENLTVYSNTIKNTFRGVWMYGTAYDDVVANNKITNADGVFVMSSSGGGSTDLADYFVRIIGNTITGLPRLTQYAGIGVATARQNSTGKFVDVQSYSTEIRGNTIVGDNTITTHNTSNMGNAPYSGIYVVSTGFSTTSDGTGTGDTTNTVIEGNKLSNLITGVSFTTCNYGIVLNNNHYDNSVLKFLDNKGSDNTLVTNNTQIRKGLWGR